VRYDVGIDKAYFPKSLWRTGTEFLEVVKITATSRSEAASKAWQKHGNKWLSMMNPQVTTKRIVSLYVNSPDAGVGGTLGRLSTIEVYRD